MTDPGTAPETTTGGDPVCWLDQLCPECGAMPSGEASGETPGRCWRCGHPSGPDPDTLDRPGR